MAMLRVSCESGTERLPFHTESMPMSVTPSTGVRSSTGYAVLLVAVEAYRQAVAAARTDSIIWALVMPIAPARTAS